VWAPRRQEHTTGQGNEEAGTTVRWGSVWWRGPAGAVAEDDGVQQGGN
jgi:hypothetical protein